MVWMTAIAIFIYIQTDPIQAISGPSYSILMCDNVTSFAFTFIDVRARGGSFFCFVFSPENLIVNDKVEVGYYIGLQF